MCITHAKTINFLMLKKTRKKDHTQYCLPQFWISACGTPPHLWALLGGVSSCGHLTGLAGVSHWVTSAGSPLIWPCTLTQLTGRTADQESKQRLHGDDAVFKRTCWACRGPEFGFWHFSGWFTAIWNSCSGGYHGFYGFQVQCTHIHKPIRRHTHT